MFKIENRKVGTKYPPLIIAEIGINKAKYGRQKNYR